jgi:hypothetical protein
MHIVNKRTEIEKITAWQTRKEKIYIFAPSLEKRHKKD